MARKPAVAISLNDIKLEIAKKNDVLKELNLGQGNMKFPARLPGGAGTDFAEFQGKKVTVKAEGTIKNSGDEAASVILFFFPVLKLDDEDTIGVSDKGLSPVPPTRSVKINSGKQASFSLTTGDDSIGPIGAPIDGKYLRYYRLAIFAHTATSDTTCVLTTTTAPWYIKED